MSRIIAIANQKGGVGKTTTSINLSAALAEYGKCVLVIDFDPQGNLTSGLGIDKNNIDSGAYELLLGLVEISDAIIHTEYANLDLIPSNVELSAAEMELLDFEDREFILQKHIHAIRNQYDFIIIDCPPSLSLLSINSLVATDTVLVPVQCEYYALEGLTQVIKTIHLVKDRLNPNLEIEGLVFTMYDARNNLSQQVVDNVRENIEVNIFDTIIPRNVRLAEAPSYGMPIVAYDEKSAGAESYRALAKEVAER